MSEYPNGIMLNNCDRGLETEDGSLLKAETPAMMPALGRASMSPTVAAVII